MVKRHSFVLGLIFLMLVSSVNAGSNESWSAFVQMGGSRVASTAPNGENDRAWIKNANINTSGSHISILYSNTLGGGSNEPMNIGGASLCIKNASEAQSCEAGSLVRITMNGSSSWVVATGGYNWSDCITFDFDQTKDHFSSVYFNAASRYDYVSGGSGVNEVLWLSSDQSQTEYWGSSGTTKTYLLGTFKIRTCAPAPAPPSDTCTYGGSGDWNIDASDNCVITVETKLDANILNCYGVGTLTIGADITCDKLINADTCRIINTDGDGNTIIVKYE